MGDPKKQRKKFSKPGHPWQADRIAAEKDIVKQYGLKRKNEVWKADSMLQKFLHRAKTIIGERNEQSDLEKKQLLDRLSSLGLLKKDSKIEDVLNLKLKDFLDRRLQTLVYRKQLAKTVMQAREFIVHEHVSVAGRKITTPSYLVSVSEESQIKLLREMLADPIKAEKKSE